jgi:polar amino acid transport system permease protein
MTLQFAPVLEQWPYLLGGAWVSLQLAVLVFAFGMLIGLVCASLQRYGSKPLRRLVDGYVTFATNTPQLVQIFFLFFVLPGLGVTLPICAKSSALALPRCGALRLKPPRRSAFPRRKSCAT